MFSSFSTLCFSRTNGDVAPVSTKQPEEKEADNFDGVDFQTEKLSHPTANRAKPPQRRPPSGLVTAIQVSNRLVLIYAWGVTILEVRSHVMKMRQEPLTTCQTTWVVLTSISLDDLCNLWLWLQQWGNSLLYLVHTFHITVRTFLSMDWTYLEVPCISSSIWCFGGMFSALQLLSGYFQHKSYFMLLPRYSIHAKEIIVRVEDIIIFRTCTLNRSECNGAKRSVWTRIKPLW